MPNRTVQVRNEKSSKHEKKHKKGDEATTVTTTSGLETKEKHRSHKHHHRSKEEKRKHRSSKEGTSEKPHAEMKKAKHHTSTSRAKAEVRSKSVRKQEVAVARFQKSTRLFLKDGPITKLIRMFSDRIAIEKLAHAAILEGSLDEDEANQAQFEKAKIKKNRLKIARAAIDNLTEALQHALHQFFANGVVVKDKVSFRQRRVLGMVDCLAALECDSNLKGTFHDFIARCNAQFDEFIAKRLIERNLNPVTKAIASAEKQLSDDKDYEFKRHALPVPLTLPEPELINDDLLPRILAAPAQQQLEEEEEATPPVTPAPVPAEKASSKKRKRSEEHTTTETDTEASPKKKDKKSKRHHSKKDADEPSTITPVVESTAGAVESQ